MLAHAYCSSERDLWSETNARRPPIQIYIQIYPQHVNRLNASYAKTNPANPLASQTNQPSQPIDQPINQSIPRTNTPTSSLLYKSTYKSAHGCIPSGKPSLLAMYSPVQYTEAFKWLLQLVSQATYALNSRFSPVLCWSVSSYVHIRVRAVRHTNLYTNALSPVRYTYNTPISQLPSFSRPC